VVVDLETTGLDASADEIIEFAAWRLAEGQEPQVLSFLVRPSRKVSFQVLRLTGITEEELAEARPLEERREEIIGFLADAIVVGHNIQFDLIFLERTLGWKVLGDVWDTLELARIFFPGLNSYRLGALVESLNLSVPAELHLHRASSDAWLAGRLLEMCWEKALSYDLSLYHQAQALLAGWRGRSFFEHLRREIGLRFPERRIRTDLALVPGREGLFAAELESEATIPDDPGWVVGCFAPGGALERNLPGFESRSGQLAMAKAVTQALVNSEHLIVEAGTGTGKSFAYLIPGLWWAKKTGRKVVVSTHTIPLQEQISGKDVPVLQQVLPFAFKCSVVKGKGNYLCLKRWLVHLQNCGDLNVEERVASLSVLVWLRQTRSGDFQELPATAGIAKIWPRLNADGEACMPARCPHAAVCFFLRARRQAEEADLLIVNHSLFFSDIRTNYQILPEHRFLVVDEAHHFYSSAQEHLGVSLAAESVERIVARLHHVHGLSFYANQRQRLGRLAVAVPSVPWDAFKELLEELPGRCESVSEQAGELFRLLAEVLGDRLSLRLVPGHRKEPWWPVLTTQLENLAGRFDDLDQLLRRLSGVLEGEEADEVQDLFYELNGYRMELETLTEGLPYFLNVEDLGRVTWLELSGARLLLRNAPVDVSELLRDQVFARLQAVILTSATLSVAGSFAHFIAEIGFPPEAHSFQVESPFAYDEQMQLLVVRDLIAAQGEERVNAARIAGFVGEVAALMRGRTLVLFTSHQLLRATYYPLQAQLQQQNIGILAQGIDGSRGALLEEFKRSPEAVLLGANSFWEGIDIPGEALSCVIMVKLPFWPPNLPLIEARAELLVHRGRDAFRELHLPQAVIRFKQGFGRLIRSKADRGLVIVLDSRVVDKSYGRYFLGSLPLQAHVRGQAEVILRKIAAWAP